MEGILHVNLRTFMTEDDSRAIVLRCPQSFRLTFTPYEKHVRRLLLTLRLGLQHAVASTVLLVMKQLIEYYEGDTPSSGWHTSAPEASDGPGRHEAAGLLCCGRTI